LVSFSENVRNTDLLEEEKA